MLNCDDLSCGARVGESSREIFPACRLYMPKPNAKPADSKQINLSLKQLQARARRIHKEAERLLAESRAIRQRIAALKRNGK
jgi:hypothetical protein